MPKKKILIIEDSEVQFKVFDQIMQRLNYQTLILSSGKTALEFLNGTLTISNVSKDEIGLVLLDLALPDITGMQILKELKIANNTIPVAVLSATEELEMIIETIKLGADNFFIKGKDRDHLNRLCSYIEKIMGY